METKDEPSFTAATNHHPADLKGTVLNSSEGHVLIVGMALAFLYTVWHPWLKAYSGESRMDTHGSRTWCKYAWLDQDLKEEMTGRR